MANMARYRRKWNQETRRWVYEHRTVAEKMLGRPLTRHEVVHHKDGNWLNNDPSNLEIVTRARHMRIHMTKSEECSVEGCVKAHHAKNLCKTHYAREFRAAQGW